MTVQFRSHPLRRLLVTSIAIGSLALRVELRAQAQPQSSSAATASVRGIVFDSITNAPVARAVVQVASTNPSVVPFSDTTDATGRFQFSALPLGRYVISFDHDKLRVWGVEAPLRALNLTTSADQVVDLGLPSAGVLRELRCGVDTNVSPTGMVTGTVYKAETSEPAHGATVDVAWTAIVLQSGNFRTETVHAKGVSAADGQYTLCGVPVDAPVELNARVSGMHRISGIIRIPENRVLHQDIALGDSLKARGTAVLTGIAKDEKGKRVASGHATIKALALDVPINNGLFNIADVPFGTWLVEVKAIGYEPTTQLTTVSENAHAIDDFVVSKHVQALEAVTVIGTMSRETKILDEIIRRHRSSPGTVFLPGNPALAAAAFPADVVRNARGFRYKNAETVEARVISNGFMNIKRCATELESSTPDPRLRVKRVSSGGPPGTKGTVTEQPFNGASQPVVQIYLNGEKFIGGLQSLNRFIQMRDVLAIETFPDVSNIPQEWRTNDTCAVISVWTRQR